VTNHSFEVFVGRHRPGTMLTRPGGPDNLCFGKSALW
jgi:hypothetical protein